MRINSLLTRFCVRCSLQLGLVVLEEYRKLILFSHSWKTYFFKTWLKSSQGLLVCLHEVDDDVHISCSNPYVLVVLMYGDHRLVTNEQHVVVVIAVFSFLTCSRAVTWSDLAILQRSTVLGHYFIDILACLGMQSQGQKAVKEGKWILMHGEAKIR